MRHLDRRRQVENEPLRARRLDDVLDRLADVEREIEFGAGETFRRIFELKMRARRGGRQRLHLLRRVHRNLGDALAVGPEHDVALQGRCRIVKVYDDLLGALHRLERAFDQLRAALGQHLDSDVVRNCAGLNDRAHEVEIGLRSGWKSDLDFLEPHTDQELEHPVLALDAHRLDQRLIAIAKVDRAPDRRLLDDLGGPLPVRQDNGRVGAVLLNRHLCHDEPWKTCGGALAEISRPTLPVV